VWGCGMAETGSGQGPVVGFCDHGKELECLIKGAIYADTQSCMKLVTCKSYASRRHVLGKSFTFIVFSTKFRTDSASQSCVSCG
jgi:hypothetical protein